MKTRTTLTQADAARMMRWRVSPISNVTPTLLARYLEMFDAGYMREAAGLWQQLEERDDLLRTVTAKRKKSVARYGWSVLPKQGLPHGKQKEARAHQEALEFFYGNLSCENSMDASEQGGFQLLARQMMDAVGKRYAVHEIVWRQDRNAAAGEGADRRFLTALFRFVPLGFFENTTGQLRFIHKEGAQEGTPLTDGAWMVTAGDGLMKASSLAWMTKQIALNDWLRASQRQGTPALHGSSAATRDSDEWNALVASLEEVLEGKSLVTSTADSVEILDLLKGGHLPFEGLVERTDRLLAALWRGADLSTLSRDRGYGASLQEKETFALEEDDAANISETLNRYVDRYVIRYVFGQDAEPLAHVRVLLTPRQWTSMDLEIDRFLIEQGAPLSVQETMLRYGRAIPQPGESILHPALSKPLPSARAARPTSVYAENESAGGARLLPSLGSPQSIGEEARREPRPTSITTDAGDTNWIHVAPLGQFNHSLGTQYVTLEAARDLVAEYESLGARFGRLFGGAPVYAGHPDLPDAPADADRTLYGTVEKLEARGDGVHALVKWTPEGKQAAQDKRYKFVSPYWAARRVAGGVTPSALISLGLTNRPNLPVNAFANESNEFSGLVTPHVSQLNEADLPKPQAGELRDRRNELAPRGAVKHLIASAVERLQRGGMPYDDAWAQVKEQHPEWFTN